MGAAAGALAPQAWIDLILVGVLLEGCVLLALRRSTGRGVPIAGLIANLVAGAGLLLALRQTLGGEIGGIWLPAFLLLALVGHITDLALRWQRAPDARHGRL